MKIAEHAARSYRNGRNCAQSILETYLPETGIDRETASRLGAGLGGGIGGRQETCGALNGGAIALSYAAASRAGSAPSSQVAELVRQFKAEFGSARCIDILGYDKNDPKAVAAAPADAKEVCARCVEFVARYLDEHLRERKESGGGPG
jgi:C_GCAxxG_C_C family probable redox protein